MKMKMYRSSGAPVLSQDKVDYYEALNREMDALEAKMGKCTSKNAKAFSKALSKIHRVLTKQYPIMLQVKYPDDRKDMQELCAAHGALAFCVEDEALVCYIMDA